MIIDMASTSQGRNFELALSVAASLLLSTATHESVVLELDGPSGPSRYTGVAAALTALSGAVADRATEAGGVTAVANWNSGIVIAGEGTLIPRYARGPVIRCTATPPTGSAVPGQVVIHVASLDDLEEALEAGLNLTPRRRAHPTP